MMGNKRKKKNDSFWPFCHCSKNGHDMVVCNFFDIRMFILSRTAC